MHNYTQQFYYMVILDRVLHCIGCFFSRKCNDNTVLMQHVQNYLSLIRSTLTSHSILSVTIEMRFSYARQRPGELMRDFYIFLYAKTHNRFNNSL